MLEEGTIDDSTFKHYNISEQSQKAYLLKIECNVVEKDIIQLQDKIRVYHEKLDTTEKESEFSEITMMLFADSMLLKQKQKKLEELKKNLEEFSEISVTVCQIFYPILRSTKVIQVILDQPGMFKKCRLVCKEWNEYLISKVRPDFVVDKWLSKIWFDWPDNFRYGNSSYKFQLKPESQKFYDFVVNCVLAHGCGHNMTLSHLYTNGLVIFDKPLGRAWHVVDYVVPECAVKQPIDKLNFDSLSKYLPPTEIWNALQGNGRRDNERRTICPNCAYCPLKKK